MARLRKINATTYAADLPRARVEIGDGESEQFLPVAKIDSFEGETRFKVGYADRPYSALGLDPDAEEVDRITLTEGVYYPPYGVGVWYAVGDLLEYQGGLYEVVQAHTSQEDWPPPEVPALYKVSTPPGVIAEWEQKEGAHDAYDIGDMVLFEGKVWRSLYYPNTWTPTEYPDGWEETDGRVDVDCYFIEEYGENRVGAFEFEIVLRDKPASNVVTMHVEMDGLVAHYQPPLTQEEIDEGAYRPEDVVGSYAVYHATCGQMHRAEDAEKYQTGKAFHIYRPKVMDANGAWVWGVLFLDGETLSITVDQAWLDSAAYPVRVDPTFGYVDENGDGIVGGTEHVVTGSGIYWTSYGFAPDVDGKITGIYRYIRGIGNPDNAICYEPVVEDAWGVGYVEPKPIDTEVGYWAEWSTSVEVTSGVSYVIASGNSDAEVTSNSRYYDVGEGTSYYSLLGGMQSALDTENHTMSSSSRQYSIYCTYEEAAPIPVPVLTAEQVGADIKLTWVYA